MTRNPKTKRILVNILIIIFLSFGTFAAVLYAKGYRPNLKDKSFQGSGLLSVTSYPKSARVIINDKLTTVTDDKLYLYPGNYTIKIEKDGFHPWTKTLPLKSELVSTADARLFPIITATSPLTFYQASNPTLNPDGTKVAYVLSQSPTETANGLYIHSFSNSFLGSQYIQIADSGTKDFTKATLVWSPDSTQILAVFTEKTKSGEKITSSLLLSTKGMNNIKTLSDATLRLPVIISEWQDLYARLHQPILSMYPIYINDLLTQKAVNVYFSPSKEKVFYTANTNLDLPPNDIAANLPNTNSTTEDRQLKKGQTYVFDLKEGTNYHIPQASTSADIQKIIITAPEATPTANIASLRQLKAQSESYLTGNLSWYSNSSQLVLTNSEGVNIVDYDDLNLTNISYVQPLSGFAVSSPDGSRLTVLTNINQKQNTYNLISFDLK